MGLNQMPRVRGLGTKRVAQGAGEGVPRTKPPDRPPEKRGRRGGRNKIVGWGWATGYGRPKGSPKRKR